MGFFSVIKRLFGMHTQPESHVDADVEDSRIFLGVRIPEAIYPTQREAKYGEPLEKALRAAGIGEVTGGGTQMGEGNTIEYVDLEVAVTDRDRGIEIIRQTMRACGAPPGTIIEDYSADDEVREWPV